MASKDLRKPRGYWSKERIISELRKLNDERVDLSDRNLRKIRKDLYMAILHRFKNLNDAMKAAKLDYSKFRREKEKGFWTRNRVTNILKQRAIKQKDMSYMAVRKDSEMLAAKALYYFKTWPNVLESIGLDHREHCRQLPKGYWTKDKLKEEIKRIAAIDKDLSARHWCFQYQKIFTAANRAFGNWENALKECDYDYSRIRKVRIPYTKDELLDILKGYQEKGIPLDWNTIREMEGASTCNIIIRRFGSYQNAIEALGLDYYTIRKDAFTHIFLGSFFEKIVKKAFELLSFDYDYQPTIIIENTKIRPDFIDKENNIWYDVKLDSWSGGIRKTIENYISHAERLIILYLTGNQRDSDQLVEYRQIDYYYKDLRRVGGQELIDQFEMMKKGILRPDMQKRLDAYISRQMKKKP